MQDDKALDAYIDEAARLAGLTITDAQRPGVRLFLGLAAGMAGTLEPVPVEEPFALAPVFPAGGPDGQGGAGA